MRVGRIKWAAFVEERTLGRLFSCVYSGVMGGIASLFIVVGVGVRTSVLHRKTSGYTMLNMNETDANLECGTVLDL